MLIGVLVGFGQLDTNLARHIWEEGILVEKLPSYYWPVGKPSEHFLDDSLMSKGPVYGGQCYS